MTIEVGHAKNKQTMMDHVMTSKKGFKERNERLHKKSGGLNSSPNNLFKY